MQYKCDKCNDTGSRDKSGDYLDCTSCEAPAERMALESFIEKLPACGGRFQVWQVHQRALAMAPKQEAPKVVADDLAHEIMNSMAVHVDDWADGLDYEPSKAEVSGKALCYILSRVALAAPAAANGALPDLPEIQMDHLNVLAQHYTADQMRAYGQACAAASNSGSNNSSSCALTDERIQEVYEQAISYIAKDDDLPSIIAFARAILAAAGPDAALIAVLGKLVGAVDRLGLPEGGQEGLDHLLQVNIEAGAVLSGAKGN